jgi:glycosyltransferase involved in cell wall biosynthesis
MMQKKILVLAHTSALGGASRSLDLSLRHLTQSGAEVVLCAPRGLVLASVIARFVDWSPPLCAWLGLPVYSTYITESSFDRFLHYFSDLALLPIRLWKAAQRLSDLIEQERPSVLYLNSLTLFPLASLLARLKKKYHIRVIWHIRETLNEKLNSLVYRWIASGIARVSDRIIAISSSEARAFLSFCQVEILYNSVSMDWSEVEPSEEKPAVPLIAMGSAYRPSKGVDDFIRTAELVKEKFPQVEFCLYAPHPIPPRFRGLYRLARRILGIFSEKLAVSLDLVERLSRAELNRSVQIIFDHSLTLDAYHAMAIYVRSDRSGSPWGRDVIEAMWAGLPVVTTGSSQEFVQDGVTGFLVPPCQPEIMSERICRLLGDRDLLEQMSAASYRRARGLFDPTRYGVRLSSIFEAV